MPKMHSSTEFNPEEFEVKTSVKRKSMWSAFLAGMVATIVALSAQPASALVAPDSGPVAGGTSVAVDVPTFEKISAGGSHSLALVSDGTVWSWGSNLNGKLGDGTTTDSSVPVKVDGSAWGSRAITQVSSGGTFSAALASDGTVWTWGWNLWGQLGNGTTVSSPTPVQVNGSPWGARTITRVEAGNSFVVALASDGTVWAWGLNDEGVLGDGTETRSSNPIQVNGAAWGIRTITDIAVGEGQYNHVMALADDGTVWVWGGNDRGQLGIGTAGVAAGSLLPVQADGTPWGSRTVAQIAAGFSASLVLASDGTMWSWGRNSNGQLGNGLTSDTALPGQVNASPLGSRAVTQISLQNIHALVLANDGTVWGWGDNSYGELGTNGVPNNYSTLPLAVDASNWGSRSIESLSTNSFISFAIAADGSLWAWGRSAGGSQYLGSGATQGTDVPLRSGWTYSAVSFGDASGTDVVDEGSGTVSVVTPAHPAGAVDVTVATSFLNGAPGPDFVTLNGFTFVAAPPVITTTALPGGEVATSYSVPVMATGDQPIRWAVDSGTLPAGLVLDPDTGVISGTPGAPGVYTFSVSATNQAGVDVQEFTVEVASKRSLPKPPIDPPVDPPVDPRVDPIVDPRLDPAAGGSASAANSTDLATTGGDAAWAGLLAGALLVGGVVLLVRRTLLSRKAPGNSA